MGAENDGVRFTELLNKVSYLNDLNGVEAHGGLVQNDDLGVSQKRLGDADALPVALGQSGDQAVFYCVVLCREITSTI